ncbi:superoxide dismutase [Flavobacterium sp. N2820]|uniref:superoxide dismutase n=1 Tax=Flavobacterium sp. N2820 TaxID=2986834 RepID=UPI0029CAAD9F|nr:superoxide dismutase [Flavobacterium sp. N2820]
MKKVFIISFLAATLLSCKKDNELIEVKIPDPEVPVTQTAFGNPADVKVNEGGVFKMKGLKYAYDALAPFIDGKTMEIHYSKHHLGYANKLNKAIAGTDLETKTIEEILSKLDLKNAALRNNAGGYYNHNLFFESLNPKAGGTPSGELAQAIATEFGSFDEFQKKITEVATNQFGSGWAWLVITNEGKLALTSTSNQDNPLMPNAEVKGTPILAIDVWEHAYYLNYQNKRADYLTAIFNVIDWNVVNAKYELAISKL